MDWAKLRYRSAHWISGTHGRLPTHPEFRFRERQRSNFRQLHSSRFQLTDASDPENPVVIATPKITVIAEQEANMSIGESNKQFIEIEVVINEGEPTIGTTEFSIIKGDRRASGKITALVGQAAELQTGDFRIKVLIEPQSTNRE